MNQLVALSACVAAAAVLVSCQGTDSRAVSMNYSDAVVCLAQVDPAYRGYFRSQEGGSYSRDEQRKAIVAAVQTSRTPVPSYAPERRLATRKATTASRRRAVASSRSRAAASKRTLAKNRVKSAPKSRAVARNKSSKKALAGNNKKRRRG